MIVDQMIDARFLSSHGSFFRIRVIVENIGKNLLRIGQTALPELGADGFNHFLVQRLVQHQVNALRRSDEARLINRIATD